MSLSNKTSRQITGFGRDLSRTLELYQTAIDLNLICSVADVDGNIIYANKKFCELSQFSEEELIGQNHRIVNSGYHPSSFFRRMWQTILSGQTWQGEVKCKAKDGSFFWVHSTIIPVMDEHQNIIQFFSLRYPVDDKKRTEMLTTRYINTLEKMLYELSHQVRYPSVRISMITELLDIDEELDREEYKILLHELKKDATLIDKELRKLNSRLERLKNSIANSQKTRNAQA